jgi:thioredoxin-like negative regulator of GroEL
MDNNSSEYMLFRLKSDGSGTKPAGISATVNPNVPPEAQKEFERAEVAFSSTRKESVAEGIRHLEKALSIYPKFVEAGLKLGTAYMDAAEWEKAEQTLRKTQDD